MPELFFAIGVGIIILAWIFAFKHRHNTSELITCLLLGVLFSTIIFVFPTEWKNNDTEYVNSTLYAILSSVLYGFKSLGGGQDISRIETVNLCGIAKTVYIYINYFNFFLAPIITSSLIISFFGDTGEKIKYHLKFSRDYHYFACISEKTISLAEGIKNSNKNAALVFCDAKGCDKGLSERIRAMGGILLYEPCQSVFLGLKVKNATFYLLSASEDKNIDNALSLIEKFRNDKKHIVTINAFASDSSNVKAVEILDKGNTKLHFIDENVLQCYQLLCKYPLHEQISEINGKNILSVIIIGAGKFGRQMLKTVSWCGQLPDTELKICVFDKCAIKIKEEFFAEAPELTRDEYDIRFINVDISDAEFASRIKENADDATICIISLGDDSKNIAIADTVFSLFKKLNGFDKTPLLLTRIRKTEKTKNLSKSDFLIERNIVLFGDIPSIYSSQMIFHSQLEKVGLMVHLCYCNALSDPIDDETRKYREDCIKKYYNIEYNRNSSMAVAVHIRSKVYFSKKLSAEGLSKDKVEEILARNEHERWNAFMRSEGFVCASENEFRIYAPLIKKNWDKQTKLHNCLTEWDELDKQTDIYNQYEFVKCKKDKHDFKKYDYEIVRNAPLFLKELISNIEE